MQPTSGRGDASSAHGFAFRPLLTMLQRSLFSCSPRFTSHLACHRVPSHIQWQHSSQLAPNAVGLVYPFNPINTILSHWANVSGPYRRIEHRDGHPWRPQRPWSVPYNYRDRRGPHGVTATLQHASMSAARSKSPKRQRVASGDRGRGAHSKMQKVRQTEGLPDAASASSRSSRSEPAPRQGFTQGNWPQEAEECQWRRSGKEFRTAQTTESRPKQEDGRTSKIPESAKSLPPHPTPIQRPTSTSPSAQTSVVPGGPRTIRPTTIPSAAPAGAGAPVVPGVPGPSAAPLRPSCKGFHSSAASGQAQGSSNGSKPAYTKRIWSDAQRQRIQTRHHRQPSSGGGRNGAPGAPSVEFTILSYNVLAQGLLESNSHLYRHCPPEVLPWEYRRRNILAELKQSDADVICLQEVQSEHFYDFFRPELVKLGYKAIYKKRTGDKGDGCATLYRTSRFGEAFHSQLEYQRGAGCLDRDNVAVVVLLQPRGLPTTHQLCVANTHLLWNPRRGDVKLAQLGLLFAEIERIAHVGRAAAAAYTNAYYHPVVICGDFNSLPHCPLYKFVKKGHVTYEGMAAIDVSGQEEGGGGGGRSRFMKSPLWPREIGVTPRCRYSHRDATAVGRAVAGGNPGQAWRGPTPVQANNNASHTNPSGCPGDHPLLPAAGGLVHPFFFSSVYEHGQGNREVTTNHSRTNCTVDYIFFTRAVPHPNGAARGAPRGTVGGAAAAQKPSFSSNLSVVRRLSLFTDGEVRAMGGLPNAHWSSDHLSLQARLCMTPIYGH